MQIDSSEVRQQRAGNVSSRGVAGTARTPGASKAAGHDALRTAPRSVPTIDFRELFGRDGPVEIDIGCGEGTFLTALAQQNPERNFLGIERLPGRVRAVCRKAAKLQLGNVRVLCLEAGYAISELMKPETVSAIYLLFPDPWPKRRHHRRRTITTEFVASIAYLLVPDGSLYIATDHAEYFARIKQIISASGQFEMVNDRPLFPSSAFEKKFITAGATIHRLRLRKISPVK